MQYPKKDARDERTFHYHMCPTHLRDTESSPGGATPLHDETRSMLGHICEKNPIRVFVPLTKL